MIKEIHFASLVSGIRLGVSDTSAPESNKASNFCLRYIYYSVL